MIPTRDERGTGVRASWARVALRVGPTMLLASCAAFFASCAIETAPRAARDKPAVAHRSAALSGPLHDSEPAPPRTVQPDTVEPGPDAVSAPRSTTRADGTVAVKVPRRLWQRVVGVVGPDGRVAIACERANDLPLGGTK